MSWGIVPAAALSLICAMADASLAGTSRSAAREILARASRYEGSPLQINGKWGFQYYLQLGGGRPAGSEGVQIHTRGSDRHRVQQHQRAEAADGARRTMSSCWLISRVPFPFVAIHEHAGAMRGFTAMRLGRCRWYWEGAAG
jgi:hypothetical protein